MAGEPGRSDHRLIGMSRMRCPKAIAYLVIAALVLVVLSPILGHWTLGLSARSFPQLGDPNQEPGLGYKA